jgi:hypothetical protein
MSTLAAELLHYTAAGFGVGGGLPDGAPMLSAAFCL